MSKKDPADGIDGFQWWTCSNCAASGYETKLKTYFVKCTVNPAQPMPSDPKMATVYCPDCEKGKGKLFCTACAGRSHCIGTKLQHHSLEAINPEKVSWIYFLPPGLDFIFLPTIFFITVVFLGQIPTDYMAGRDFCPLIHNIRRKTYHFDAGLTYLLKDGYSKACNLEDGYFRLIIDAWVRAIKTDSDSLLLLASAVFRGWIFHKVAIQLFVLPFLVLMHMAANACLYITCAAAERLGHDLPALVPPSITRKWHDLCYYLQLFVKYWYDPGDLPPPTDPRERPRCDWKDATKYWTSRKLRIWKFFYATAQLRVGTLTVGVPLIAAAIRLLCITTSFDWYLRRLFFLPGDVSSYRGDMPIDALGHTLDQIVFHLRPVSLNIFRVAVPHMPYAIVICAFLLYGLYYYVTHLRWWIDTRNWYGAQCGKAPKTDFSATCRWFPQTWETEAGKARRAAMQAGG